MKSKLIILILCVAMAISLSACDKEKDKLDNTGFISDEEKTDSTDEQKSGDNESSTDEKPKDIQYVIYLKNKDLPNLLAEMYTINSDDLKLKDKTIEKVALEELFNYQQYEGYVSPIPKGTKLIDLEKEEDTVYVNLSKEFKDGLNNKDETEIAIASIVNTLTFFHDNEYVFIKIEGENVDRLNNVDLSNKFSFNETYIPSK